MRQTKTAALQVIWNRDPLLHGACIEFRAFDGWYATWVEPRHFGDNGEFLGANFQHAKRFIESIQRSPLRPR